VGNSSIIAEKEKTRAAMAMVSSGFGIWLIRMTCTCFPHCAAAILSDKRARMQTPDFSQVFRGGSFATFSSVEATRKLCFLVEFPCLQSRIALQENAKGLFDKLLIS
jgi:hypothetical protein